MKLTSILAIFLLPCAVAAAQTTASKAPPTTTETLLREWNDTGRKLVAMAEDFPEAKYKFRPVKGVRTFGEQLLHVAFWNEYVAKTATGKKMDTKLYRDHSLFPGGLTTRTAAQMLDHKPTELVRRAVWGMLPKGPLGRKIIKKLKIYASAEHPHAAQKPQALQLAQP